MDEEVFIEEIKKYEELYDKGNKFYMDVKRKDKIWKNFNEKFKTDVDQKHQEQEDDMLFLYSDCTINEGSCKHILSVLVGIPVGVTFLDCVGYIARVEGISMQPALNPDADTDYVFLSRWAIRNLNVNRGDIISLVSPKDPGQKIIKRVVALQGDVVSTLGYKKPFVRIPDGHCWVEGDHTGNSLDSNSFGAVSLGLMTAKATYIVWPPSRWQSLHNYLPKQRVPISLGKQTYNQRS